MPCLMLSPDAKRSPPRPSWRSTKRLLQGRVSSIEKRLLGREADGGHLGDDLPDDLPDDLINHHYTHREAMDGSTILQQHNNLQKQISAFEKLLQHAMNKFSTEKLCHMLRAVCKNNAKIPASISSISNLHELLDQFKKDDERLPKGLKKDETVYVLKYFLAFFDDVAYLKKLKKSFDEKIYMCLYDYFYDPEDDIDGQYDIEKKSNDNETSSEEEIDTDAKAGHRKYEDAPDRALQMVPDQPELVFEELNDKEKLSFAVRDLYNTNQKWELLFDEESIDSSLFDDDSRYDLMHLKHFSTFENLLRLVPDIFVKAFKSLDVAKLWWTQANKVYDTLPIKRNSAVEFNQKAEGLERNIAQLRLDVMRENDLVKHLLKELDKLQQRENRCNELGDSCERVEKSHNVAGKRYNEIVLRREALAARRDLTTRGSAEYDVINVQLRNCDKDLLEAKGQVDILDYQMRILQGDFECALQVRPDMIYFTADLSERVEGVRESLEKKKSLKRNTEKRLVLLRTNCDRMRHIMRKYIKSVSLEAGRVSQDGVRARFSDSGDKESKETAPEALMNITASPRKSTKPSPKTGDFKPEVSHMEGNSEYTPQIGCREKNRTFVTDIGSDYSSNKSPRGGESLKTPISPDSAPSSCSTQSDREQSGPPAQQSHQSEYSQKRPIDKPYSNKLRPRVHSRKNPVVKNSSGKEGQQPQHNYSPRQSDESQNEAPGVSDNDGNEADIESSPHHTGRKATKKPDRVGAAEVFASQHHITNDSILNRKPFPKDVRRIPQRLPTKQTAH